jgi:hypothetical protein
MAGKGFGQGGHLAIRAGLAIEEDDFLAAEANAGAAIVVSGHWHMPHLDSQLRRQFGEHDEMSRLRGRSRYVVAKARSIHSKPPSS